MNTPLDALRAGLAPPARAVAPQRSRALVVGGAGPLGAAVLEQVLGGGFERVAVLVSRPVEMALRGVDAWLFAGLPTAPLPTQQADTAVVVFDRERHSHGREARFVRPVPAELPRLAQWLQTAGVRCLVLVTPHAPALLPQALKAGLASLDEHAVAAMGFEQLAIVRPAHLGAAGPRGAANLGQRVARGLLAQLHWMVPQREQPLRAQKVAQFVAELALALPGAPARTRVAAPELLWDWAQPGGGSALLQAWLHGRELTAVVLPGRRW